MGTLSGRDLDIATPRWELWGLGAGLVSGLFDLGLFWLLGERFHFSQAVAVAGVTCLFAATTAALGYFIGRLLRARRRERADRETIAAQLVALEASQRQAMLNEKLAAIGRLAAGIAHEVRNPLGVIRASAKMVQEGFVPSDDAHRACQFICEEIDRLNGLITSLLNFARPARLRVQRVQLDVVFERALTLAAEQLSRQNVQAIREGATPLELDADPDLLSQVLLGLITNAAEAIELPAGGRIALRVATTADEVRVEIADSGPGLSEEQKQRVFEPFFTTKPKGTGLGLAMALRIVEAHRGVLQAVEGRGAGPSGTGACFELRLPMRASPELAAEEVRV